MPMALVAIEQSFPQKERILDDALAYRMLSFGPKIFVRAMRSDWTRRRVIELSERTQPGIWGGLLCRKRYIDEKLLASRDKVRSVVNLGAGFDTRLYRLPGLASLLAWEVDQSENMEAKKRRLREALGSLPSNVKLISIDFDREDLSAILTSQGYSTSMRTFFLMEAVTQYLTGAGIATTFDFLAKAASGSHLVFSYVRKDFFDGRAMYGWEAGYRRFVLSGIWQSAMEPDHIPDFLVKHGWKVLEHKGYDEMARAYIAPAGRALTSTPVERMIFALKM